MIAALQFIGKSMGPSNIRYALIVHPIHIKQTNVRSDNY